LGAFVTTRLAHVWPQHLIALHLNLLPLPRNPAVTARNEQEQTYLTAMANWLKKDTAYIAIQATRPQTLALALNDSPAGLAAWIGEKFRTWSDPGTDLEKLFDIDALLANICLYWFTGSIGASFWPYHSRYYGEPIIPADAAIAVPTAYAEFPLNFCGHRKAWQARCSPTSGAGAPWRRVGISQPWNAHMNWRRTSLHSSRHADRGQAAATRSFAVANTASASVVRRCAAGPIKTWSGPP
jgi:hypothetical protein